MNRFLTTPLTAALAALLLATAAPAQKPAVASRPTQTAGTIRPFETAQMDANSWVGRFGATNCSWFDMGDGVLLIDTGATAEDARNLLAEVRKTVPGKPLRWVVMTHLHSDSNNGFSAMLPTDVTLVVNRRAVENVRSLVHGGKGKTPTVLGVAEKLLLITKTQSLEIHATPGPAHTDHDLWVWAPASGVVCVGDLVTPGRCPMTSDHGTDPKGWLAVLDQIEALHSQSLVPTRGPVTSEVTSEIRKTRAYLSRILEILGELKAKNAPEARISGELFSRKIGDYCPSQLDAINGLELYPG